MTLASSAIRSALELERYDLNIGRNNSKHHTELFGEERLIVRRGQRFDLTLHVKPDSGKFTLDDSSFSLIAKTGRPPPLSCKLVLYDAPLSDFTFAFNMQIIFCLSKGPIPTKESGTLVTFPLHQLTDETQWSAVSSAGPTENTILVSVTSPPDAPIGKYTLTLDQQGNETSLGGFTLLYNAWCHSEFCGLYHLPY